MNWLAALHALVPQATPAVLVTVASVEGSAPREPGAKMLVTAVAQFDSIGGGHLEQRAMDIAREMLSMHASLPCRVVRFALGPSLGQCCGGVVHLAFEPIAAEADDCFTGLAKRWREQHDCWRLVDLDSATPPVLVDRDGNCLAGVQPALLPRFDPDLPCHMMRDEQGRTWLVDPCLAHRRQLILFGAGHVGAALVRALSDLPCNITWVDTREDIFPVHVPANVKIELTDTPEAVVDLAPAGASFLVMTHSRALDQRLSEAILRRADAGWFGLIGSHTKRKRFEHRLRERGIAAERLAAMACPIGLPGISGKAPAVIAASVCAQLLQVWEAAERAQRQHVAAPAHAP
jgi:xanthine dehydrogenase accessory factor